MHFLAEEGIENVWSVTSSYHDADTSIISSDKSLMSHFTVILEKMIDCWTSQTAYSTYHVDKKWHYNVDLISNLHLVT